MRSEIIIFFGLLVVGAIILAGIILFIWWLKLKKIKKQAPDFSGEIKDWKQINYDPEAIERRRIKYGKEGRTGRAQEEAGKARSGEGGDFENTGDSDEREIAILRERIARAERELAREKGN